DGQVIEGSDEKYMYFNGTENVPASLIYKGTSYAPVAFLGKTLGHDVKWDGANNTIVLSEKNDPKEMEMTVIKEDSQVPTEINTWVKSTEKKRVTGSKTYEGKTYILFRSAVPHPGYGFEIVKVEEKSDEVIATVKRTLPDPNMMYPQVISYKYALVAIEATDKPVVFEGDIQDIMGNAQDR
ncbi:MAG: stalk domain-containing protein, partial [Bacilli bacterium]